MIMTKISSFFERNDATISFIRWVILPVIMAACFWVLDGRYLSKADFDVSAKQQNAIVMQVGNEQKQSFNRLTDAITALAIEQRNMAEYQRNNSSASQSIINRIDKHEAAEIVQMNKIEAVDQNITVRLNKLDIEVAKIQIIIKATKG